MPTEAKTEKEITVEEKLKALYELQTVSTEIDKIKTLRGELPLEVQDLEDEIIGLQTRIQHYSEELKEQEREITSRKIEIEDSKAKMAKYKEQQDNVRNNREYDFLTKEIEFQSLEIELSEKRIQETQAAITFKKEEIANANTLLNDRKGDLAQKQGELEEIVAETKQEEERLRERAKEIESMIEPRLLTAFKRIRKNVRNGLSVVTIQRDACGGCFNKIPPQRQMEIRLRKKVIVCEYCGRILVDPDINTPSALE
jgi:predicted  nucleic acid-binding Zn-ribbon protein